MYCYERVCEYLRCCTPISADSSVSLAGWRAYVIQPRADATSLGEAGPSPSYLDPGSGGPEDDSTNRNTTFMTRNLMHLARMLKDAGGFPARVNRRSEWDAGCRFDLPNPEFR